MVCSHSRQIPTTPVICVSPETGVAPAPVVLEACAGQHAVFLEPRSGKGPALLARVDHACGIREGHASCRGVAAGLSQGHATGLLPRPHTAERKARLGARPRQGSTGVYLWASRLLILCFFLVFTVDDRSSNEMPAGVRAALAESAREGGQMGDDDARNIIARTEKEETLFEECCRPGETRVWFGGLCVGHIIAAFPGNRLQPVQYRLTTLPTVTCPP